MTKLFKYFAILFLSVRISRERLKDFCEDHITRLNANNPGGIFTVILDDVTTDFTAYFGDFSNENLNITLQKGKTTAMESAHSVLVKLISKDEKLVAFKYTIGSEIYIQFYPNGITEYIKADLPTLQTIGLRYKLVLASHSADFDSDFVTEYNTTFQTFLDNRTSQHTAMSNVSAKRSALVTTKLDICKQMTYNLLTIAREYIGDESKSDVYFSQAILNAAFHEAASKVSNDIIKSQTENCFDNTAGPETKYMLTVIGEGTLYFGFAPTAETQINVVNGKPVDSTSTQTFTAAQLGWTPGANTFLNVTSEAAITVSYVMERV